MAYFDDCKTPNDLYNAIQVEIVKIKAIQSVLQSVPEHMRGNVRLKPNGFNYFERGGDKICTSDCSKVYIDARACYLKLRSINRNIPKLELPSFDLDQLIGQLSGLQAIQDLCLDAQDIWDKDAGKPPAERTVEEWKKPRGYTGSNAIIYSTVGKLKQKLHLPTQGDEKNKIPRSTLGSWRQQDSVTGGELEGETKTDPITCEVYYPNKWLKKRILNYKPKYRNP